MLRIDRFWADTLPQEILDNEETFNYLMRLNMNTHVANEREAMLREAGEH